MTVSSSLQVIFSACELGVFDLLLKSQEPLSAQHVAQELSTSVDGMERLLDALVGIEILDVETTKGTGEKEEEEEVMSFELTLKHRVPTMLGTNMAHTDLLNVNSFVQQHRRGKSLPGQRQRQVSSRHDHLPIPDHLPTVEQHGGCCQVSGFSWEKVI